MKVEAIALIKGLAGVPTVEALSERLVAKLPEEARARHRCHELLIVPINRDGVLVAAGIEGQVACEIRLGDNEDELQAALQIGIDIALSKTVETAPVYKDGFALMKLMGVEHLIKDGRVPVRYLYDTFTFRVVCIADRQAWADVADAALEEIVRRDGGEEA